MGCVETESLGEATERSTWASSSGDIYGRRGVPNFKEYHTALFGQIIVVGSRE